MDDKFLFILNDNFSLDLDYLSKYLQCLYCSIFFMSCFITDFHSNWVYVNIVIGLSTGQCRWTACIGKADQRMQRDQSKISTWIAPTKIILLREKNKLLIFVIAYKIRGFLCLKNSCGIAHLLAGFFTEIQRGILRKLADFKNSASILPFGQSMKRANSNIIYVNS